MAQGDLNVANQSGAAFRADLNNQLAALGTLQSGASAPSTTFAYMLWADTTTGILKLRNAANSAWIDVGTLASTNLGLALAASPTFTGTATFTGDITMSGTGFLDVPVGTTAQRPASPTSGMVRFNTTTAQFEGYGTAAWSQLGNTALSGTNRIINGDMRVDQRNAGSAVSVALDTYTLDRWFCFSGGGGVFSVQRDTTTAPTGFVVSLKATVTTADASIAATDEYAIVQFIEGFNASDLGFGAAGASTVTVSFWVRSSVAGSHGFALKNSALNRTYPTSYTISAANTWEYKTITIAGDTAGTWLTNSARGIEAHWSLGSGTSMKGTANAWAASNFDSATGTVNPIATLGATFNLAGVQLEAGTVATPFERRSYDTELALCQRYYQATNASVRSAATAAGQTFANSVNFAVHMRATPTISLSSGTVLNSTQNAFSPSASGFRHEIISLAAGDSYSIDRTVIATAEL